MDRMSHYRWELTADELDTIWWALSDRYEAMYEKAKNTKDEEMQSMRRRLGNKCYDLREQINRMRSRCY